MPLTKTFSIIQDKGQILRKSDIELMVMYCWVAWYARNKFIFERKKIDPRISIAKAEVVLEAYQRVQKTGTWHLHNTSTLKQQKWEPPPRNMFKLNVDAAVNMKEQLTGLGVVIKDS